MCSKFAIGVLLFVICDMMVVQSFKAGAPGVCVVVKQVKKTKLNVVTVTLNKWCGRKKCVVKTKKPITYTKTERQTVCCKGWVYQAVTDSCVPSCSTGCFGGRCVAPDKCVCDPPTILDPEQRNKCVTPTCDLPCVNSECVNNTCVCAPKYDRFNATHCYSCDAGHAIGTDFTCRRKCDDGYTLKEAACEPVCQNCNGKCVAPDVCDCFEGYVKNGSRCEPICNKCTGRCIAPNVCECADGYRNSSGGCVPICNGCDNGFCSAPNTCTCNDGFARNVTSGECEKKCSDCTVDGVCSDNCTSGLT